MNAEQARSRYRTLLATSNHTAPQAQLLDLIAATLVEILAELEGQRQ